MTVYMKENSVTVWPSIGKMFKSIIDAVGVSGK